MKTKNGADILRRETIYDGSSLVLCYWEGHLFPYVVWRMDGNGDCNWGMYCQTLGRARELFATRLDRLKP